MPTWLWGGAGQERRGHAVPQVVGSCLGQCKEAAPRERAASPWRELDSMGQGQESQSVNSGVCLLIYQLGDLGGVLKLIIP